MDIKRLKRLIRTGKCIILYNRRKTDIYVPYLVKAGSMYYCIEFTKVRKSGARKLPTALQDLSRADADIVAQFSSFSGVHNTSVFTECKE